MLTEPVTEALLSILLDNLSLGFVNELILLLGLGLFKNLTDLCMGVIDRCQFHLRFKYLIYYND